MDKRAKAFVDTIKSKLLIIENNWKDKFPNSAFSTYKEQFAILVHRNLEYLCKEEIDDVYEEDEMDDVEIDDEIGTASASSFRHS